MARRGRELYERDIRPVVEPEHIGEFVVLDVLTGEYEVGPDQLAASQRLRARLPNSIRFATRVGYRAAGRVGGSLESIRDDRR